MRYIFATIRAAVVVFVTALLVSVLLVGEETFASHPGWRDICAAEADVVPCIQFSLDFVSALLQSAWELSVRHWQAQSLLMMSGGFIMVVVALIWRQSRFVTSLLGALAVLLLLSGIFAVGELDRQTVMQVITRSVQLTFTAGSVAALMLGSLMLLGVMLRGGGKHIKAVFVVRTAHSTYFPQSGGDNADLAEQNLIGDIDGDTGVIRVSRIHSDRKTKGLEPPKNSLVRLTSLNQDQKSGKVKQRSIYRRWDTLDGFSDDPDKSSDKKIPLKIENGIGPQKATRQYPLCVMHLQDRVKLFGDKRPRVSTAQKKKYDIPGDNRDFAVLRIERAAFWNWFHYVFNHTDPAVAWSFRVGLAVSLFLMIVQITFLEPILTAGGFVLN